MIVGRIASGYRKNEALKSCLKKRKIERKKSLEFETDLTSRKSKKYLFLVQSILSAFFFFNKEKRSSFSISPHSIKP